jgi:hypothetical protein
LTGGVRVLIEVPPGEGSIASSIAIAEAVLRHPGNQTAVVVVPSDEGVFHATLLNRVDAYDPGLAADLAAAANCEVRLEGDDE